jgi:Ca2+:H+ antiporter
MFVSAACLGLYLAFLFIQINWHRAYFLPVGEDDAMAHARPSGRLALASLGLLLVALLSVVLLAKSLAPALEAGVGAAGAPLAIVGVIGPQPATGFRRASISRLAVRWRPSASPCRR